MQTTRGISAVMASSMPAAATGGLFFRLSSRVAHFSLCHWRKGGGGVVGGDTHGTKMAEAVAPVSLTASPTEAKTGLPRCVSPAFLGLVPPTTLVPGVFLC